MTRVDPAQPFVGAADRQESARQVEFVGQFRVRGVLEAGKGQRALEPGQLVDHDLGMQVVQVVAVFPVRLRIGGGFLDGLEHGGPHGFGVGVVVLGTVDQALGLPVGQQPAREFRVGGDPDRARGAGLRQALEEDLPGGLGEYQREDAVGRRALALAVGHALGQGGGLARAGHRVDQQELAGLRDDLPLLRRQQ